jgi:hypothetical protein
MTDDWRASIDLADHPGLGIRDALHERRVERDARGKLGDRVVVSADGPRVFLYTDSEASAREALEVVLPLLEQHDLRVETTFIARWDHDSERWEEPEEHDTPEEDHAAREAAEAALSEAQGFAEWEVRVELPSHEATVELARRLESEEIPVVRRWTFLLVGANNEDQAHALADRIRAEAPDGATVHEELSGAAVWRVADPYPFAVLGGLGG